MLLCFEKLKPTVKDIIISDCTFDGKMQLSLKQASRFQTSRSPESLRKFQNCNVKTQILNCLYKFHRFLSTAVPKIRFLAPLIQIHHRGFIFIHVNSVLLHRKTKHPPSILSVVVFSLPLNNKSLELYYRWTKR